MADFLLPLFLALLLVVMFGPLYRWFRDRAADTTNRRRADHRLDPADGADSAVAAAWSRPAAKRSASTDAAIDQPRDRRPTSAPCRTQRHHVRHDRSWPSGHRQTGRLRRRLRIDLGPQRIWKRASRKGVQEFLAPLALRTTQFLGGDARRPGGDGPGHLLLLRRRAADGAMPSCGSRPWRATARRSCSTSSTASRAPSWWPRCCRRSCKGCWPGSASTWRASARCSC